MENALNIVRMDFMVTNGGKTTACSPVLRFLAKLFNGNP